MNSNRGQYNSVPLYNLKSKMQEEKKAEQQAAAAAAVKRNRYALLSIIMSLVLPALFIVALLVPNNILRWTFLGLVLVSVLMMWGLRAFVKSARNTLTVIYGALALVIGLALFMNQQPPETRAAAGARLDQSALFTSTDAGSVNAMLDEMATEPPATQPPEMLGTSDAEQQVFRFFSAWSQGSASEMVQYCTPLWVSKQAAPESTLFLLLMRSRPVDFVFENVSGSSGSATRVVTIKVSFTEGEETSVQRMHVITEKINDVWYVDPDSLDGVPVDAEAEAAAAALAEEEQDYPQITIVPATPTPSPAESSGIVVYYNKDGGKYYHASRTCEAVRSEYWPLTEFSFDLINSQQFKNLKPCTKCNPPARP